MEEKKISRNHLELPPIKILFENAWVVFKKSLLSLFLIDIASIGAYSVLGIVVFILFSLLFWFGGANNLLTTILLLLFTILALGAFITISITTQNAMIFTVASAGELSLQKSLKKGLFFVIPLFLAHVLSTFLELGGFFLFIIPGILFSFFFIFISFEVLLENRHWIHALRRSFAIVQKHFGEIFIRILILVGIYIVIAVILPNTLSKIDKYTGFIVLLLSFFVNIFLKWFMLVYIVTLYKQAKAATDERHEKSIFWIVLTSIAGWMLGLIIISGIITAIHNLQQNGELQRIWNMRNAKYHHTQQLAPNSINTLPYQHTPYIQTY